MRLDGGVFHYSTHSDTQFFVTVITCPDKSNILSPFVIQGPSIPYQTIEAQQSYVRHFERKMIKHNNPLLWLLVQLFPKVLSRYSLKGVGLATV